MACTRPLKGYKAPGGKISFSPRTGYTDLPSVRVKCGQCLGCRLERKRAWAIRAVHESQMHRSSCFLTLTYDNKHLPKDRSVDVRHWQLFAKKLRRKKGPFRFLHCGEYGEKNQRPHYHACIFGHDFHEDRTMHKKEGHPLWISEELGELWGNGFSTIGTLTFDSAAYVAGYCVKKSTGKQAKDAYTRLDKETGELWEVKPDYATMSRRPGLGYEWYQKFKADVYPEDVVIQKGQVFRPPAYYDTLLEKEDPELWEKIQSKRKQIVKHDHDYQDECRLLSKEKVLESKMSMYSERSM